MALGCIYGLQVSRRESCRSIYMNNKQWHGKSTNIHVYLHLSYLPISTYSCLFPFIYFNNIRIPSFTHIKPEAAGYAILEYLLSLFIALKPIWANCAETACLITTEPILLLATRVPSSLTTCTPFHLADALFVSPALWLRKELLLDRGIGRRFPHSI